MEYKVLIKLFVPEIEEVFEVYIPINKTVGEVSGLLNQLVHSLSDVFPLGGVMHIYNRRTNELYNTGLLIRDTDIRNGTELVMIS